MHNNNKTQRGFWEASSHRECKGAFEETNTKAGMNTSSYDPTKITIHQHPSREEVLLEKIKTGQKLTKTETFIIENHKKRIESDIKSDIEQIRSLGIQAKPQTVEGKLRILFMIIKQQLEKNQDEMVYYTFNKIKEFEIPDHIKDEYKDVIEKINKIIEKVDPIKLQFTKFHSSMPPLNQRGFVKLDPFQVQVIESIEKNNTIIVKAPTSAGKTVIVGNAFIKENVKIIVVVPTDPLAWQMAAFIGKIKHIDIPIITRTFQSAIGRDDLIKKIEHAGIVVGTPQYLLDYLPLLKDSSIKFDWLIVDEIHMMGDPDCKEMEVIIKAFSDTPTIALSATIGNVDELRDWFVKIGHKIVDVISSDSRFFNLQTYYYDNSYEDPLMRIHPFSTVNINDIESGEILKKSLSVTPPDIWDLADKIKKFLPDELKIHNHFTNDMRITLDQAIKYFNIIIKWMVDNYKIKTGLIKNIIKSYEPEELETTEYNLYEISMYLKEKDMTPAIIFITDSDECLTSIYNFAHIIRKKEEEAYPKLFEERQKLATRAKYATKQADRMKLGDMNDKQLTRLMMKGELDKITEMTADVSIYEPHPDFIMNRTQQISAHMIEEWYKELKVYFPPEGSRYHPIIDLLFRGVGIYCKSLPDPYRNLVQNLACNGKLGIIFSDKSLAFGVSMPVRTSVVVKNNNKSSPEIDSTLYHQMAGRAGRRGLDKEGNVILVGFQWSEIINLTTSNIPFIKGLDNMFYGAEYSKLLNGDVRWDNIKVNHFSKEPSNEDALDFYKSINDNLEDGWSFAMHNNIAFNHMMWRFRHSDDGIRVAFLLTFIKRIFKTCNPDNENTQIELSKFLANFIEIVEITDDKINTLDYPECISKYTIHENLETLGLGVPKLIDRQIYDSIRYNKLVETSEKSILRERLISFSEKIRNIQHYFFHMNEVSITRLFGKLMTRIWWVYHNSSPLLNNMN